MDRLLHRIYDEAETEQDLHARIMISRIRTIVDDNFHLYLDHCSIQIRQDLKQAL